MISIGNHLSILPSVDSTNNYAMAQIRAGLAKSGDTFLALEQTDGKGQRNKSWNAEPGANILMSIAWKPQKLAVAQQFLLSAAVALACFDCFSRYAGEETAIKWPNDIYWRDRKAGGILIENIVGTSQTTSTKHNTQNPKLHWSVIGTGININQTTFPDNLPNPVSLKQITGKSYDTAVLAKELCGCLEKRLLQISAPVKLLQAYNDHLYKRGQTVRLKKESRVFNAVIQHVGEDGYLIVRTSVEERLAFGEAEWLLL